MIVKATTGLAIVWESLRLQKLLRQQAAVLLRPRATRSYSEVGSATPIFWASSGGQFWELDSTLSRSFSSEKSYTEPASCRRCSRIYRGAKTVSRVSLFLVPGAGADESICELSLTSSFNPNGGSAKLW